MPEKNPLPRQIVISLGIYIALGGLGFLFSHLAHSGTGSLAPPANQESVAVSDIGQKVVQPEATPTPVSVRSADRRALPAHPTDHNQTGK